MNLNEQVQRLLDLEAIRDLPRRYAQCVWNKDAAAIAQLFAEDGVMDAGMGEPMRGRATIASTYAPIFASSDSQPFVHNHVIEIHGDTATGTVYLDVRVTIGGKKMAGIGTISDAYVRAGDGWLFQSRKLTVPQMIPFGESVPSKPG
jgi:uncharacterized protein (TIGR02246 family)